MSAIRYGHGSLADIMERIHCLQSNNEYIEGKDYDANFKIRIPSYQRLYSWDKSNIEDLKEALNVLTIPDKVQKAQEQYFGQILIYKYSNDAYDVIDGQQRLTTFMLLFKVLLEDEHDLSRYRNNIEKFLYLNGENIRFEHQENNKEIIEDYVFIKETENRGEKEQKYKSRSKRKYHKRNYGNIVDNFQLLQEWWNSLSSADKDNFLANLDKISFAITLTEDFELAYQIFQSVNSKGRKLTDKDLIKSKFIGSLKTKDVEDFWIELDKSEIKDDEIVRSLETVFRMKYNELTKGDKELKTYQKLEKIISSESINIEGVQQLFKEFQEVIEEYRNLKSGNLDQNLAIYKEYTKQVMSINYQPLIPILLRYLIDNKEYSKKEYKEILDMVLYFPLIYVTIYGQRPVMLIKEAYEYLKQPELNIEELRENLLNKFPDGIDFIKQISKNTKIKEEASKELLFLIENNTNFANRYENHLEHILPQKSNKKDWVEFYNHEDYEVEDFVKFIGNHILCPATYNKKARNKSFDEKKKVYEACITDCVGFKEIRKVMEKKEFTPDDVLSRSEEYAKVLYDELKKLKVIK